MDQEALRFALRSLQRIVYVQTHDTMSWVIALSKMISTREGFVKVTPGSEEAEKQLQFYVRPHEGQASSIDGKKRWHPIEVVDGLHTNEALVKHCIPGSTIYTDEAIERHFVSNGTFDPERALVEALQADEMDKLGVYLIPNADALMTREAFRIRMKSFVDQAMADDRRAKLLWLFGHEPPPSDISPFVHLILDRGPTLEEHRAFIRRILGALSRHRGQPLTDVEPFAAVCEGYSLFQVDAALARMFIQTKKGFDPEVFMLQLHQRPPAYGTQG